MRKPKDHSTGARKRLPRAKRCHKKRKNPLFSSFGTSAMMQSSIGDLMVSASLHGASFLEKTIVSAVMPGLLAIVRGGGKFNHEDHWKTFKPHCPQIAGVLCPKDCKRHGELRFDGCHVCDCLHGGKG
jgi:hypothetical protein